MIRCASATPRSLPSLVRVRRSKPAHASLFIHPLISEEDCHAACDRHVSGRGRQCRCRSVSGARYRAWRRPIGARRCSRRVGRGGRRGDGSGRFCRPSTVSIEQRCRPRGRTADGRGASEGWRECHALKTACLAASAAGADRCGERRRLNTGLQRSRTAAVRDRSRLARPCSAEKPFSAELLFSYPASVLWLSSNR